RVAQQRHLCPFRRRLPGIRLPLNEIANLRRRCPHRLVERSVDDDPFRDGGDDRDAGARLDGGGVLRGGDGGLRSEPHPYPERHGHLTRWTSTAPCGR